MIELTYRFAISKDARFVTPMGMTTPHVSVLGFDIEGARVSGVAAPNCAQMLAFGVPEASEIALRVQFAPEGPGYPEQMFHPTDSRYTRSAAALAGETRSIAEAAGGGAAGLQAIVNHVAGLFEYGHPEERFYDGQDELPQLCSLAQGSCVDINAYLIAALRAAGYEAGYIYGVFVPEEKQTWAEDGHCWVVTRHYGVCQEWDIAHFLKMGMRDIRPGLNPKPGVRLPMAHSMGWTVPALGIRDFKLMGLPLLLTEDGVLDFPDMTLSLTGYQDLAAQT
ncbi:transglutaminase-like domain-containing protein [Epibacterium ulvae]|uniref:transglutaminase-like domain-containing protein n=1 Tax=Epibacterium ulvae TaxID=1156985 RepID=UPI001BFC22E5|nr:transglutaminase-like domain-containing protein [Epibacterium ulvae]MBT8153345.1 transglutaminase-like domain-containing protein [Epibacterium ulvae]